MSVRFMLSVERQPPSENADALCESTGNIGFPLSTLRADSCAAFTTIIRFTQAIYRI